MWTDVHSTNKFETTVLRFGGRNKLGSHLRKDEFSKHGNHKVGKERWEISFIKLEMGRLFYIWHKYSEAMKKIDKFNDVDIKSYYITEEKKTQWKDKDQLGK